MDNPTEPVLLYVGIIVLTIASILLALFCRNAARIYLQNLEDEKNNVIYRITTRDGRTIKVINDERNKDLIVLIDGRRASKKIKKQIMAYLEAEGWIDIIHN